MYVCYLVRPDGSDGATGRGARRRAGARTLTDGRLGRAAVAPGRGDLAVRHVRAPREPRRPGGLGRDRGPARASRAGAAQRACPPMRLELTIAGLGCLVRAFGRGQPDGSRLPPAAHTSRPWRIHELAAGLQLEDVWALPTPGGPDDFPRLVERMVSFDPSRASSVTR